MASPAASITTEHFVVSLLTSLFYFSDFHVVTASVSVLLSVPLYSGGQQCLSEESDKIGVGIGVVLWVI